jgi:hypothetical protein
MPENRNNNITLSCYYCRDCDTEFFLDFRQQCKVCLIHCTKCQRRTRYDVVLTPGGSAIPHFVFSEKWNSNE